MTDPLKNGDLSRKIDRIEDLSRENNIPMPTPSGRFFQDKLPKDNNLGLIKGIATAIVFSIPIWIVIGLILKACVL